MTSSTAAPATTPRNSGTAMTPSSGIPARAAGAGRAAGAAIPARATPGPLPRILAPPARARRPGGAGNDVAQLGTGDDAFVWNPGDGSDVVEGGAGTDTLAFNGANIAENISISANGTRTRLFRDIGTVTMDLNGVEHIQLTALGGADIITVGDLTGTGVNQVDIDLSATPRSDQGDGAADSVTVNGTGGNDNITVTGAVTSVTVTGLPEVVSIDGAEGANAVLTLRAGAGNDTISAATLPAAIIGLTLDGGAGNDTITASQGNEHVLGR